VVIESAARFHDNARITTCILRGAQVTSDTPANSIIGPDYAIDLTETVMQPVGPRSRTEKVLLSNPLFTTISA